jgi:hypothetical protein
VLARHVEVTGIDDETTFSSTFEDEIRKARASVWLWAPWVANRVRGILHCCTRRPDAACA